MEPIRFVAIEGIGYGAYSVEVGRVVVACNHNYCLCRILTIAISRVYIPSSIILVCSLIVLG